MKLLMVIFLGFGLHAVQAKEWNSLIAYQKETQRDSLSTGDWLTKDRKQNTQTWQKANAFNLIHQNAIDYQNVEQRLGFYNWLKEELEQKGNEFYWVKMAAFISSKLRLISMFPYKYVVKKTTIENTNYGSELVFKQAFPYLKKVFLSEGVLIGPDAEQWDLEMLHREQYEWVESIYQKMDDAVLFQISKISKGNGLFGLFVPNAIKFSGDLKKPEDRYQYAVNVLLPYCKSID